tara:strand:+ start:250 stop:1077 length:828 start_codon:yes stop_codon:yes gene_type:complete
MENWKRFLNEQEAATIHFMDWLIDKTDRVHSKPGQGSIFAKPTKEVVEIVKNVAGSAGDVDKIANSTGVLSSKVPGIGYDLVARVVDGKPVDPQGNPIEGQLTKVNKEEGRDSVSVNAIVTDHPLEAFKTDDLTVIVRPMKDAEENVLPGQYIILSAFPGTTGADERASEWGDKYVVVVPKKSLSEEYDGGYMAQGDAEAAALAGDKERSQQQAIYQAVAQAMEDAVGDWIYDDYMDWPVVGDEDTRTFVQKLNAFSMENAGVNSVAIAADVLNK